MVQQFIITVVQHIENDILNGVIDYEDQWLPMCADRP